MKVINSIQEMRAWSAEQRKANRKIGLVPTMGYLHEGHLSLIREARKKTDCIVVTIYVNPTQFAPGEDLEHYPRDFARDEQLCKQEGVEVLFYPSDKEMYSPNHSTYVLNDELSRKLCGKSRPTHFRGVTTIVTKLFNIINPHFAVFGQKDAQQSLILNMMVQDLNFDIELIIAPIIREDDGLAMSSRNKYLSDTERQEATVLYKSLCHAENEIKSGNTSFNKIKQIMQDSIERNSSGKIDYIEIVDVNNLEEVQSGSKTILVALAVFFAKTRLIDNTILRST
jgi:pantoate--beta-alanine ligase